MNTSSTTTGLYWFRHDLRLDDQPALTKLAERCDKLLLVYCIDSDWFKQTRFGVTRMGHHRQQFLYESLQALNKQLDRFNQCLLVVTGNAIDEICQLINAYQIDILGTAQYTGFYEQQQLNQLHQRFPNLSFVTDYNASLFELSCLPFDIADMKDKFTPFRKLVESTIVPKSPCSAVTELPGPPISLQTDWSALPLAHGNSSSYHGCEKAALKQLKYYFFDKHLIKTYKETRNGLDGWNYSSKLSAWLANGSLSVRRVYAELKRFEAQHGANESTYWLYFELLWREFFFWQQLKHGQHWFSQGGIQHLQQASVEPTSALQDWQNGNTSNPHINACMHQLNATGYMSNRARQWAASYLIHELQQDWRHGAAYFEQQLIDFDVGSNWGNWQYLAGVGSDPRGHRQFNIDKQAQLYDPDNHFKALWA